MSELPDAPLWSWRDQTTCAICAPHFRILTSGDQRFLWRLSRCRGVGAGEIARLNRLVALLDSYAVENGIAWP